MAVRSASCSLAMTYTPSAVAYHVRGDVVEGVLERCGLFDVMTAT
jgi:hypothetical protein